MGELVQLLSGADLTGLERQEVFERLRKAGRIDEYVQAVEALAAADPENADLQVALGHAYLQKLFGLGNSPEAGPLAMKSDAAFDRALEIDDGNWGARFSKAVALSNWPAFMGRGPEAIEHFELLLEQQAEAPERRDEFAMTYLFLGNMYQAAGDTERALATWKAGLALFPGMDDLERAIELAGGDDSRTR
jgi:tetratricopeptide (TPR) repeat protein